MYECMYWIAPGQLRHSIHIKPHIIVRMLCFRSGCFRPCGWCPHGGRKNSRGIRMAAKNEHQITLPDNGVAKWVGVLEKSDERRSIENEQREISYHIGQRCTVIACVAVQAKGQQLHLPNHEHEKAAVGHSDAALRDLVEGHRHTGSEGPRGLIKEKINCSVPPTLTNTTCKPSPRANSVASPTR